MYLPMMHVQIHKTRNPKAEPINIGTKLTGYSGSIDFEIDVTVLIDTITKLGIIRNPIRTYPIDVTALHEAILNDTIFSH